MGSGEGETAVELIRSFRRQRGAEHLGDPAGVSAHVIHGSGAVGGVPIVVVLRIAAGDGQGPVQLRSVIGARDRRIGIGHRLLQVGGQPLSRRDDLRSQRDELVVPDVQGAQGLTADAARPRRLEKGVALLEHAIVVGQYRGEARGALDEELIGEPAPSRRVSTDDLEVFRREEDDVRVAGELVGLRRRAVDARLVRPLPIELHLDEHTPLTVGEPRTDDRVVLAVPHHRSVGRHPMRPERREEDHGFGEVRLALAVPPDEDVRPSVQGEFRGRVIAEIDQAEVLHNHGASLPSGSDTPSGRELALSAGGGWAAAGT